MVRGTQFANSERSVPTVIRSYNQYLNCRGEVTPPSRFSVPNRDLASPHRDLSVLPSKVERWMTRGKISQPGLKDPTNFLPKMVANCGEDLFFWSSLDFAEKRLQFPAKTFFLFLVFIQFRRRKYIISS